MILPTKYVSSEHSLIGTGAAILSGLRQPTTVSSLWENLRTNLRVGNFEHFALALCLLYAIGAVEMQDGLLRRRQL